MTDKTLFGFDESISYEEMLLRRRDFYAMLGEFVFAFAYVEESLHLLLWHFASVPISKAKALFSGVKIKTSIDLIGRLTEGANDAVKSELKFIFDQLQEINNARNLLLHYPIEQLGEWEFVASNELLAMSETRLKKLNITPELLFDMIADLKKIQTHIRFIICTSLSIPRSSAAHVLNASWRYKPSQSQKTPRIRPPKQSRRQRRQRQSSLA